MQSFNAPELINKAERSGGLRRGEAAALRAYISSLENRLALSASQQHSASAQTHVELHLATDGSLSARFPGQPSHSIPLGARPDIAMDFLLRALRERQTARPKPIASPGAPTAWDLEQLRKAFSGPVRKAPRTVTSLEELGL